MVHGTVGWVELRWDRFPSKLAIFFARHSMAWSISIWNNNTTSMNRDSSVGTATGYGLDGRGSIPGRGWEFCSSTPCPRPALGPTDPPIQWSSGALSLGVKRPGHDADHSPQSSSGVKGCVKLYLRSPIRLHRVVLS
jgi:hypothetical protein